MIGIGSLQSSCAEDRAETTLFAVIDTDLRVSAEVDNVELNVVGPTNKMETRVVDLTADKTLPLVVKITPADESMLSPVVLQASGRKGTQVVVKRLVRTGFFQGESRLVKLGLTRLCVGATCGTGQTCAEGGVCVSEEIPPTQLAAFQKSPSRWLMTTCSDVTCPAGKTCIDGRCVDDSKDADHDGVIATEDCNDADPNVGQGECRPGTQEDGGGCDRCGTNRRTCLSTCTWDQWTCVNQGECSAGEQGTDNTSCGGSCGTPRYRTRSCSPACKWNDWSACTDGTHQCTEGQTEQNTRACACGGTERQTRTCSSSCTWGAWSAWSGCSQGQCVPQTVERQTQSCTCNATEERVRTCTSSCTWGSWGAWSGCPTVDFTDNFEASNGYGWTGDCDQRDDRGDCQLAYQTGSPSCDIFLTSNANRKFHVVGSPEGEGCSPPGVNYFGVAGSQFHGGASPGDPNGSWFIANSSAGQPTNLTNSQSHEMLVSRDFQCDYSTRSTQWIQVDFYIHGEGSPCNGSNEHYVLATHVHFNPTTCNLGSSSSCVDGVPTPEEAGYAQDQSFYAVIGGSFGNNGVPPNLGPGKCGFVIEKAVQTATGRTVWLFADSFSEYTDFTGNTWYRMRLEQASQDTMRYQAWKWSGQSWVLIGAGQTRPDSVGGTIPSGRVGMYGYWNRPGVHIDWDNFMGRW